MGPLTIRPPVASSGAAIGVGSDQARFVGRMMDRRIFVVHPDGGTLGYDVIPDGDGAFIQPPFAFRGAGRDGRRRPVRCGPELLDRPHQA